MICPLINDWFRTTGQTFQGLLQNDIFLVTECYIMNALGILQLHIHIEYSFKYVYYSDNAICTYS